MPASTSCTDARPAELDRQVVGARLVLGGNSTALLNLAAVHRTPAVRVMVPELAPLDAALGSRQRSLLDAFLPPAVPVTQLSRVLRVGGTGRRTPVGSVGA